MAFLVLKILLFILSIQVLVKLYVFFFIPYATRRKMLDKSYGNAITATGKSDLLLLGITIVLTALLFFSGHLEYVSFVTGLYVGMTLIQLYFHHFSKPLTPEESPKEPVSPIKLMSYAIQANPGRPWKELIFIGILFVWALVVLVVPSSAFAAGPTYGGGDGSSAHPYLISTCEQLEGISQDTVHLSAHYALAQDIDCSATSISDTGNSAYDANLYNSGQGFVPVGSQADPFYGTLTGTKTGVDNDGNYYSINGLTINRPTTDYQGLFGYASSTTIGNLAVHGSVTGQDNVGMLAGYMDESTVHGIDASNGSVTGIGNVGGMIGDLDTNSSIASSHSSGTVTGGTSGSPLETSADSFGGLVGENLETTAVRDSYSSSAVTIFSKNNTISGIGGLMGTLCDGGASCDIDTSYATGNISIHATTDNANSSQVQYVGGLIGYAEGWDGSADADFTENYATGNISAIIGENQSANSQNVAEVGGLFGQADSANEKQSYASGSITIDALNIDSVGGFTGESDSPADFSDDYSSGAINLTARSSDSDTIGGFLGYMASDISVERVYSSSALTLSSFSSGFYQEVGGLIGQINGAITDSFEAGSVSAPTGSSASFGGLGGLYTQGDFTFLNNDLYYQTAGSGTAFCLGSDTDQNVTIASRCTGIDSTTVPVSHFYTSSNTPMSTSWDFSTIWLQHANTFPTLRIFATDTIPPVITLIGPADVTVTKGNTYTDQGATATDNIDGDITADIQTAGSVDTNTVGTYTITYNVSDSSGNAATPVTRTVTVTAAQGSSAHGVSGQIIKRDGSGVSGSGTSGQSLVAMLEAELAALEAQLAGLQGVVATPSSSTPTRDLTLGSQGADVTALQSLLISQNTGAAAKALAAAGATGYFGTNTMNALIEYQKAHGIVPANGYYGPITRAQLK